jgi:glutamine synthetase
MNPENIKKQIEKHKIGSIDLKYADLVGNWYHITFPARRPHPFEMNLYYNL